MAQIVLLVVLAVLCFLYELNSLLRGRSKEAVGGVVRLLILVTLLAGLFFIGWRASLMGFAAMFVLFPIAGLLARPVARRLLGYRTGPESGGPELDIVGMLERGEGMEAVFDRLGQDRAADRRKLDVLARRKAVASVLAKHQATGTEYEAAFRRLKGSAIADLAWEIVSDPKDLDVLLVMIRQGKSDPELWAQFREQR